METVHACCAPQTGRASEPRGTQTESGIPQRNRREAIRGMVLIPAGGFWMGADDADTFPADGEGPVREVDVSAFHVDPVAVTNAQFAAFVKQTGYVTDAETYGWSFVFEQFITGQDRVLAATLSAHGSASFDVHVLAGLGVDAVPGG